MDGIGTAVVALGALALLAVLVRASVDAGRAARGRTSAVGTRAASLLRRGRGLVAALGGTASAASAVTVSSAASASRCLRRVGRCPRRPPPVPLCARTCRRRTSSARATRCGSSPPAISARARATRRSRPSGRAGTAPTARSSGATPPSSSSGRASPSRTVAAQGCRRHRTMPPRRPAPTGPPRPWTLIDGDPMSQHHRASQPDRTSPLLRPAPTLSRTIRTRPHEPWVQGSLALQWQLPGELDAEPQPAPSLRLVPRRPAIDEDTDPAVAERPTGSADLPDPGPWVAQLVQAVLEVLARERPRQQLVRWLAPEVYAELSRHVAAARPAPPARGGARTAHGQQRARERAGRRGRGLGRGGRRPPGPRGRRTPRGMGRPLALHPPRGAVRRNPGDLRAVTV